MSAGTIAAQVPTDVVDALSHDTTALARTHDRFTIAVRDSRPGSTLGVQYRGKFPTAADAQRNADALNTVYRSRGPKWNTIRATVARRFDGNDLALVPDPLMPAAVVLRNEDGFPMCPRCLEAVGPDCWCGKNDDDEDFETYALYTASRLQQASPAEIVRRTPVNAHLRDAA